MTRVAALPIYGLTAEASASESAITSIPPRQLEALHLPD